MTTLTIIAVTLCLAWSFVTAYAAWSISRTPQTGGPQLTYKPVRKLDVKPGMWGVASMGTVYISTEMDSGPAVAVKRQEKQAA